MICCLGQTAYRQRHYMVMKRLFRKIRAANVDEKNAFKKFDTFYHLLNSAKVDTLNFQNGLLNEKALFQYNSFVQLNLFRFLDLIEELAFNCQKNKHSASILVLRSAMEIAAILNDVILKINMCLEKSDYLEIEKLLFNRLFGSKKKPEFSESVNVLTVLKKADKTKPGFLDDYESLSEYCHPSYFIYSNFYGHFLENQNRLNLNARFVNERFNNGLIIKPTASTFNLYLDAISHYEEQKLKINNLNWDNIITNNKNAI